MSAKGAISLLELDAEVAAELRVSREAVSSELLRVSRRQHAWNAAVARVAFEPSAIGCRLAKHLDPALQNVWIELRRTVQCAPADDRFELRKACLARGRHVGDVLHAFRRRRQECPQATGRDLSDLRGQVAATEIDLA